MTATEIDKRTSNAYSRSAYADGEWLAAIEELLSRGYSPVAVEAIMRSKWTRWAGDVSPRQHGSYTAADVLAFLDDPRNGCTPSAVADLVRP